MNTMEQVKQVFSYQQDEQDVFPYIREYMACVGNHIQEILEDDEKRLRFMLAGLFLTYRAYNHSGMGFQTHKGALPMDDIHTTRIRTYEEAGGHPIASTEEYLNVLRLGRFRVLLPGLGRRLCQFVLGR